MGQVFLFLCAGLNEWLLFLLGVASRGIGGLWVVIVKWLRGWRKWAEPVSVPKIEKLWVALRHGVI